MATVDLTFADIVEEAFDRVGDAGPIRSGYDLQKARRSLNLLFSEWANRGLNMWTIEAKTLALSDGTATYNLPADTVDVLDASFRDSDGYDRTLRRISFTTYSQTYDKSLDGTPSSYMVMRTATPTITVWPKPDANATLAYYRIRRMDGLVSGIGGSPDVPHRFVPALTSGLAYYLSLKDPRAGDRVSLLKADYEEQISLADGEDRERSSLRLVPGVGL